jgi:hypothetical protein
MERRMRGITSSVLAAVMVVSFLLPLPAMAQEASWLDGDLASWNTPGMAIPEAPAPNAAPDPRCVERERPAETEEDDALMAAGWRLFLPYQRGWGVTLIPALSDYDGMCRPFGYQYFVFVDGDFAGTISPEPMTSRFDGAADDVNLWFKDQLTADFRRYAVDDPLCCPSGSASVDYTIEETPDGPVLNPVPPS